MSRTGYYEMITDHNFYYWREFAQKAARGLVPNAANP
ncbi:MAG: hypothetical protein ACJA0I_001149 [Gammaproteobacteria bacterium]|jgi:hypothetical protein